jgi:hypothetical protein
MREDLLNPTVMGRDQQLLRADSTQSISTACPPTTPAHPLVKMRRRDRQKVDHWKRLEGRACGF